MRRTPFCEPFSLTTLSSLVILVTLLGNDVSCVGRQHEGAKQRRKGWDIKTVRGLRVTFVQSTESVHPELWLLVIVQGYVDKDAIRAHQDERRRQKDAPDVADD